MVRKRYERERLESKLHSCRYERFQQLLRDENYVAAARRLFDNNDLQTEATREELLKLSLGLLIEGF
jgi:hypothetical protein